MNTDENPKNDEQATIEERRDEESEAGLKVKTKIKAGPEIQVDGGG